MHQFPRHHLQRYTSLNHGKPSAITEERSSKTTKIIRSPFGNGRLQRDPVAVVGGWTPLNRPLYAHTTLKFPFSRALPSGLDFRLFHTRTHLQMYSDEAKIKPCLRNIPFDSEGDVSQLPETGVLSILQFTLHPGVDLLQPLQPVSSLWRDSLEFISTMPGFQGLYWAPVSQDTVYQQIIIILVQWENGLAWRRFQCSIGFSMLLGYLAESFNRCIELSLPTGLSSSKSLLELVSYRYPPRLSSTGLRSSEVEEEKQRFKEVWGLSVLPLASITPSQSGRIFAFGGWLQRDSPLEDQIFIGLLFWGDTQPGRQQDQTAFDVVTRLNELSKDATSVVSCITMPLCYIPTGYSGAKKPTKPSTDSPPWKHPLLKVNVTPIYEPTESTGPGYADQVHLKSVTEAKAVSTTRISAGPARRWYCMGLLNQHYMPKRPEFTPKATLELITFRVRSGTSIAGAFKDLRLRLWNLAQDSEVRWGIDHENVGWYTRYSLLISRGLFMLNGDRLLMVLSYRPARRAAKQCDPGRIPKSHP